MQQEGQAGRAPGPDICSVKSEGGITEQKGSANKHCKETFDISYVQYRSQEMRQGNSGERRRRRRRRMRRKLRVKTIILVRLLSLCTVIKSAIFGADSFNFRFQESGLRNTLLCLSKGNTFGVATK